MVEGDLEAVQKYLERRVMWVVCVEASTGREVLAECRDAVEARLMMEVFSDSKPSCCKVDVSTLVQVAE